MARSEGAHDEQLVREIALMYVGAEGWVVGSPREAATRQFLIEDEGWEPSFADAVLAEMWALGDPAWDDKPSFDEKIRIRQEGGE